jgi:outer membrane protein
MGKLIKKFLIVFIIFIGFSNNSNANVPYFLDFKYILNQSDAGKKAQSFLKNKLEKGINNLKDKEKKIQQEEKKIISQKKVITEDEYKKKVSELRKKVALLQKERTTLLNTVAKQRQKARNELLKNLNPIIKEYMKDKNIRMVIDKKSLLLADENLNITNDIIALLNKKLKSIKLD